MSDYLALIPYTLCFLAGIVSGALSTIVVLSWLIARGTALYIKELDHAQPPHSPT